MLKLIFHFTLWTSFFNPIRFIFINFKFNKSLPIILIIKAIGVTTKKNIIPIIIGEIIFPNNNPNLNQSLFKGVKILS